jgi:structural maintenance of chromosome 2
MEQDKLQEIERLREQAEKLRVKMQEGLQWWFQDVRYRDPPCHSDEVWDRRQVKGRLLKLFTVKEDKYAKALEEIAQGKLFQVVVETEQAATLLLKHNCFKDRVTLIPVNKIQAYMPSNDVLEYVAKVTEGKAQHAVSLVKSS